jgi:hypothetical protein
MQGDSLHEKDSIQCPEQILQTPWWGQDKGMGDLGVRVQRSDGTICPERANNPQPQHDPPARTGPFFVKTPARLKTDFTEARLRPFQPWAGMWVCTEMAGNRLSGGSGPENRCIGLGAVPWLNGSMKMRRRGMVGEKIFDQ